MTLFAREHIKKAHNGRETRGVLAESTSKTVGASTWSILGLFLASYVVFISPFTAWLLVFSGHRAGLLCSIYVYWTPLCVYFVYLKFPHALNVIKYQTFCMPWRYRRDHVSHMRLDRLRRAWQSEPRSEDSPKKDSPSDLMTVFINLAATGTLALTVTPTTTVMDLREAICRQGHTPCHKQGPIYLSGLLRPLCTSETMSDLGVQGLRHFLMPPRLLGGAPDSSVVLDEHGWEQGAKNPDGTLKDAADIDFEQDPGTPPPEASGSRPKRGKNQRMMDALVVEGESDSGDALPIKKRKLKSRSESSKSKRNGKQAEDTDPEDHDYSGDNPEGDHSDSEPEAAVTPEEIADGLPTKTIPEGTSRHPKAAAPPKKKRKQADTNGPSTNAAEPSVKATAPKRSSATTRRRNAIWHFFEEVTNTNHGEIAIEGDRFFRCRHGVPTTVLKISLLMRHSITGLTSHLKRHAKDMHRFYEILQARNEPLKPEEIEIAEGRKVFPEREDLLEFLDSYDDPLPRDTHQQTIHESFERAGEKAVGKWDQAKFERLLVEWMIVCDQPFQEVERPELRRLLEYVHHLAPGLDIPSASTVQRRVMDMAKI